MGHDESVSRWQRLLWRNAPVNEQQVLQRVVDHANHLSDEAYDRVVELSKLRNVDWCDIETLGERIDRYPDAPLAEALIHGSRHETNVRVDQDKGWQFPIMCCYCGRSIAESDEFTVGRSGTYCSNHQASRVSDGRSSAGYYLLKRLEAWSEKVHQKSLTHVLMEACRRVRRDASIQVDEDSSQTALLDAFPRLKKRSRSRFIRQPIALDDLARWLGWDSDQLDQFGAVVSTNIYLQFIHAEAWLLLQEDYRRWYPEARARGGRNQGGAPLKHDESKIERAVELRSQNKTYRNIEAETGVPRSTLERRIKAYNKDAPK